MNKSVNDLRKIIEFAKENDLKIKQVLVPRVVLNDVRLAMMSLGLAPKDYYNPDLKARNLIFMDTLLVEDNVADIHAEVERA